MKGQHHVSEKQGRSKKKPPQEPAALVARHRIDTLGNYTRPLADAVARALSEVAEILKKRPAAEKETSELGTSWAWMSGLFAQISRVTAILRENEKRDAEVLADAAAAQARAQEQAARAVTDTDINESGTPDSAPKSSAKGDGR